MNIIAKALYMEYNAEKYLMAFFLVVFCGLVFAYIQLLSLSVVHVVMNKEAKEQMSILASEIAELESAYMEKQHAISTEVVEHRGYVASSEKIFLDRTGAAVVTQR